MKRAPLLALACAAAVGLAATPAAANGRFPDANQLVFNPFDPDLVLIRVTFGLLVSHDRGRTFEWICEGAIGFTQNEDPMYHVTPSLAFAGSTFEGLAISRDQGCNWSFAGGKLAEPSSTNILIDLASNPNDAKNFVVFGSGYDGQEAGVVFFKNQVFETKDEGRSFVKLGENIDSSFLGFTIDLTKSDPNRIYASVLRDYGPNAKAFLLKSTDHGATWNEERMDLLLDRETTGTEETKHYIAAVDPLDAERVYVRTLAVNADDKTRIVLREAKDGGAPTFRTIFTQPGPHLGFALTPDGSRVWVGGPYGIYAASTSDFVFEKKSEQPVTCLGVNEDGLWACSREAQGFVLGVSKDDARTFEARLNFCDIKGPLTCPSDSNDASTGNLCPSFWQQQRGTLGCLGDAGAPSDGGARDGSAQAQFVPGGGKCGCSTTPVSPWGAFVALAGGVAAVARRLRRRR